MISPHTASETWDVVVVGSGPAGLFCALGVATSSNKRVLLLDAGPDVGEREQARIEATDPQAYVQGVGGAGLFSDGKLCLSLDVGGGLRSGASSGAKARLLDLVSRVFTTVLGMEDWQPNSASPDAAVRCAEQAGLFFKHYPVLHVGTERCTSVIRALCDRCERAGVVIRPHTRLTGFSGSGRGGLSLSVSTSGGSSTISTAAVVLAMGKVGSKTQAELCRQAGIQVIPRSAYVGVRLEGSSEALEPLFQSSFDPKFSMSWASGSRIKTHCASNGGEVLRLEYEGLPLAGGHNYRDRRSGRSGFAVLWDGISPAEGTRQYAQQLMEHVAQATEGELAVQRLQDCLANRPTSGTTVSSLGGTARSAKPSNLRRFLPPEYFEALQEFVTRLARIAPGIAGEETVLYAPAVEWWMSRVAVDASRMETAVPGVFACGDGSGWSQGIVHAAATGVIAAEAICGARIEAERLLALARHTG